MIIDPMGDSVKMETKDVSITATTYKDKVTIPDTLDTLTWNAQNLAMAANETREISYTVTWNDLDKLADLEEKDYTNIPLNGEAKFTYADPVTGKETTLEFPRPKDTIEVAQLTTSYKVDGIEDEVVTPLVKKEIVNWNEKYTAATFQDGENDSKDSAKIKPLEKIEVNGTTYYYVNSTPSDGLTKDGNGWTTSTPGEHTLVHNYAEVKQLTNVEKKLVKSKPVDVDVDGVLYLDDPETYKNLAGVKVENGTIKLGKDASVKLLYTITVTGTEGAAYKVKDDKATFVSTGIDTATGTLDASGIAVLYAYRTFTREDIVESKLTNNVALTPGDDTTVLKPEDPDPDDPKDPPEEITDEETTPADKLYTVTVEYQDEKGNTLQSPYVEKDVPNGSKYYTDGVNENIPNDLVGKDGSHYVKDPERSDKVDGGDPATKTVKDGDVVITVHYTLDNWDEENPEDPDPDHPGDNIPDKYQVKVIYTVEETETLGHIVEAAEGKRSKTEIITIDEGTKNVHITGATADPVSGAEFNAWGQMLERGGETEKLKQPLTATAGTAYEAKIAAGTTIKEAHGLDVYTFTASFKRIGTYNVDYRFIYKDKDGNDIKGTSEEGTRIAEALREKGVNPPANLTDQLVTVPAPGLPDNTYQDVLVKDEDGKVIGKLVFKSWKDESESGSADLKYVGTWVYQEWPEQIMTSYNLIYLYNRGGDSKKDVWRNAGGIASDRDAVDFTVTSDEPTRDGYTFQGWAETATGAVTVPAGSTVWATREDPIKYLYAVWEKIPTYHVTYEWEGSVPAGVALPTDPRAYYARDPFTAQWPATTSVPVFYNGVLIGTWGFTGWKDVPAVIEKDETIYGTWTYAPAPDTGAVRVTKTPDRLVAEVGDEVTWTVTVENNSTTAYTNLSLTDILDGASVPAGVQIDEGIYRNPGYSIPEEPTRNVYTLTIFYWYMNLEMDGQPTYTMAAPTYTDVIQAGGFYSVPSPVIDGCMADQPVVEGQMPPATALGEQNVEINVIYTEEIPPVVPEVFEAFEEPAREEIPEYPMPSEDPGYFMPQEAGEEPEEISFTDIAFAAPAASARAASFALAPGAVVEFKVTYKVKAGDGKQLVNTAIVVDNNDLNDPKIPVGSAESKPVKVLHPELVVEKTRTSAGTARVGDTIEWSITITNEGDGTAYHVNVTDEWADNIGTEPVSLAPLATGESVTINATHKVTGNEPLDEYGRFYNTVVVTYKEDPNDPGESPKKTEDTDEGTVVDKTEAALSILKTTPVTTVNVGAIVTYTITVTNRGDAEAVGVTVTDVLDSRLTFISANYPRTGNVYTIGNVAAGGSAVLTITVGVNDNVVNNTVIPNIATANYTNKPAGTPDPSSRVEITVTVPNRPSEDPYIPPSIPTSTQPPVTPTPAPAPTTTIDENEIPLANSVGLNDTDHFAYVIGYEDDTVRPLNNITRAEAATIFFRLMTDEYRSANWSTTNSFSDVKASGWYNNAISTCAKAGVLKGYGDGTFRPNAPITRAEFASMAAGFMDESITDDGVGDFSDTANHWAASAIRRAAKAGWVTGNGNKFNPNDNITRAEVMTIVNRMLDRTPDKDHMLPTMKKWTDNPESAWYYEAVQEATNEHDYERDEMSVETWTELLTIRDWQALETEWANNGGITVPKTEGGEVAEQQDIRTMPDGI